MKRLQVGKRGYLDILSRNDENDAFDIVSYGHYDYHDDAIFAVGFSLAPTPAHRPSHQATGAPIPPPSEIEYVYSKEDKFAFFSIWRFFVFYSWEKRE